MNDLNMKIREGRFTGSGLGCPRMMALNILGHKMKISKKLKSIFAEGQEHDTVLKEEAEEEWDDFEVPDSTIFKITLDDMEAEAVLSPDGLRPDEVVEFKSLSSNNYNSMKTEEDLAGEDASPLFKKYYYQTQFYAGAFGKKQIRMRVRNKRNHKTKDIIYPANKEIYDELIDRILKVKAILDKNELPPVTCNEKEKKFCRHSTICKQMISKDFEQIPQQEIKGKFKINLAKLVKKYRELKQTIDELKMQKDDLSNQMKEIMRGHGQREWGGVQGLIVKYGIRYKNIKDKETVQELVDNGTIPTEEVPEEYLVVYEDD